MKKKFVYIILFVIGLVIIDQITKLLVVNLLNYKTFVIIKNFLKFVFVKNTGAAFGFLSDNTLTLSIVSMVLIIYIFRELKNNINNKISLFSYLLILSGSLGNLIDRIFRGYVVDFISFTFFKKEMAVFNVADSYITIGVIMLLILLVKEMFYGRNNSK